MSSNNDNAMARFLFAILQQKCLKDIDWNKVAHNPILTQEITNGHAARMRYSRFRASLLGIEPQRRNRNLNKSKVTKSKKESKSKKEKEETIKPDPNAASGARQEDSKTNIKDEATVKRETQHGHTDVRLTPADLPPVSMAEAQLQFHNRLMTPCSDTDLFAPAAGYATSPVSDMLHQDQPFDYNGAAAAHCAHEQASWQPSPSYSPFPMASYELESYSGAAVFCDHQHTPHPEGFGIDPSAMMAAPDHPHVPVKHEEWDTRFH